MVGGDDTTDCGHATGALLPRCSADATSSSVALSAGCVRCAAIASQWRLIAKIVASLPRQRAPDSLSFHSIEAQLDEVVFDARLARDEARLRPLFDSLVRHRAPARMRVPGQAPLRLVRNVPQVAALAAALLIMAGAWRLVGAPAFGSASASANRFALAAQTAKLSDGPAVPIRIVHVAGARSSVPDRAETLLPRLRPGDLRGGP